MEHRVHCLGGTEIGPYLDATARLRISVFKGFPYLYQGDAASEQSYLRSYARCPRSVFVLAEEGGEVVGVSTGLPLADADQAFRKPFEDSGISPGDWFYFGESVLEPAWRGRGIGHRFFDEREKWALAQGYFKTCFCSVVRSDNHPLKPAGYRPHDEFWTKRGYTQVPGWKARLSWCQVDSAGREVENELVFWTREVEA
ncbi:GNAT family N-acetyltransferase [Luteolibacter marinus]|uniref:GNAT family N-acetyltransferase n=1 Tax=Luteolibacter marinus TaxID=2776705 RepID=UPI001866A9D6|nr:GNAT family N-acetyltransferase [Luteolibacter marinus]